MYDSYKSVTLKSHEQKYTAHHLQQLFSHLSTHSEFYNYIGVPLFDTLVHAWMNDIIAVPDVKPCAGSHDCYTIHEPVLHENSRFCFHIDAERIILPVQYTDMLYHDGYFDLDDHSAINMISALHITGTSSFYTELFQGNFRAFAKAQSLDALLNKTRESLALHKKFLTKDVRAFYFGK